MQALIFFVPYESATICCLWLDEILIRRHSEENRPFVLMEKQRWLTVWVRRIGISFRDDGLLLELHEGMVLSILGVCSHRFIRWSEPSPFKGFLLHVFIGRIPRDHRERISIGRINESWRPRKMPLRSSTSMAEWNRWWWRNFHVWYGLLVIDSFYFVLCVVAFSL